MPIDRRSLLKGFAALTTGLVLPPTLAENVEAAPLAPVVFPPWTPDELLDYQSRRYWALDQTMLDSDWFIVGDFDAQGHGLEKFIYIKDQWYPVYWGFSQIVNRQPLYEGAPYSSWTYSANAEFLP